MHDPRFSDEKPADVGEGRRESDRVVALIAGIVFVVVLVAAAFGPSYEYSASQGIKHAGTEQLAWADTSTVRTPKAAAPGQTQP